MNPIRFGGLSWLERVFEALPIQIWSTNPTDLAATAEDWMQVFPRPA